MSRRSKFRSRLRPKRGKNARIARLNQRGERHNRNALTGAIIRKAHIVGYQWGAE